MSVDFKIEETKASTPQKSNGISEYNYSNENGNRSDSAKRNFNITAGSQLQLEWLP